MIEVVFQDQIAKARKRRYLTLHESFARNGYQYIAERKTIYRLKEVNAFKDTGIANEWLCDKLNTISNSTELSVLSIYNTNKSESLLESKLSGLLYIMRSSTILTISFLQRFRVTVYRNKE